MYYQPFTDERIASLGSHVGVEFDAETCQKSFGHPLDARANVTVSDVHDEKYLHLYYEKYGRPEFNPDRTEGLVDYVDPRDGYYREDDTIRTDPDADMDANMHGLLIGSNGYLVLYPSYMPELYRFQVTSGPEGTINAYNTIGRSPGEDILMPVPNTSDSGFNTAGTITKHAAEMEMLFPGVTDFYRASHDFGVSTIDHGFSWPHTHPAFFKHVSRKAEETVQTYGDQLDYDDEDRDAFRPPEAIAVANMLDRQSNRLRPLVQNLSKAELRIRDGRYDDRGSQDIADELLHDIQRSCSGKTRVDTAEKLMLLPPDAPEPERQRLGYWTSFQLASGVVATRQALHEAVPHPQADDSVTKRTLDTYHILQDEMQRRLTDNSNATL